MSNEISDEAWERAALTEVVVDWQKTFDDGDRSCFYEVARGRNGLPIHGLIITKAKALAAQAELDAAKNSYAGEPEEKPEHRIYKQSAGRGSEEKMICSVYIDEKRIG